MRHTIRLGRVAGIPIGVHWSALVIAALLTYTLAVAVLPLAVPRRAVALYWLAAVGGAAGLLASLLAHELAHALVAKRYGMRVERVTLWLLGGVAELGGDPPSPRVDLAVAVAGPLMSVVLAIGFGLAALAGALIGLPGLILSTLSWLAVISLFLAVFNLLPGAPLDGGRVLRALLWRRYRDKERAQLAAARAGRVLGLLLAGLGLLQVLVTGSLSGIWLALIGWFLVSAAGTEGSAAVLRGRLAGIRVADVMATDPVCGRAEQSVADFVDLIASRHRHRAFPVCDAAGRAVGVVTLRGLSGIEPRTRLADVCVPLARVGVLAPGEQLADALAHAGRTGVGLLLVVDQGRLVGVVSETDLRRLLELTSLSGTRPGVAPGTRPGAPPYPPGAQPPSYPSGPQPPSYPPGPQPPSYPRQEGGEAGTEPDQRQPQGPDPGQGRGDGGPDGS